MTNRRTRFPSVSVRIAMTVAMTIAITVAMTVVVPSSKIGTQANAKPMRTERIAFASGTSKKRISRIARSSQMQFVLRFRSSQFLDLWVWAPELRGTAQTAEFFDAKGNPLPVYDEYAYGDEGVGHWVVEATSSGDIQVRLSDLGVGAKYNITFEALNTAPQRG